MEVTKIIVINLKRRPDKKMAFIGAMLSHQVPPELIEVFEARDASQYPTTQAVVRAAREELPFWGSMPEDVSLAKGTLGCLWSMHVVYQDIASMPEDSGAVMVIQDDYYISNYYNIFQETVESLTNFGGVPFEMLQLFHQHNDRYPRPLDFPRPLPYVAGIPPLSYGLGGLGDAAMILTPRGAQKLLHWLVNEDPYLSAVEWHLWRRSKERPPGVYSTVNVEYWVSGPIKLESLVGLPDSERMHINMEV